MASPTIEDYQNAPQGMGQVKFEDDWYLLNIEQDEFAKILSTLEVGEEVAVTNSSHISVIKNELPSLKTQKWGKAFVGERVTFFYIPEIDDQNGRHFWVNCYSSRLCEMREYFAVPTLKQNDVFRVNFHLTIGKRENPVPATLRPQLRISPFTHIDAETLMQHL